MQLTSSPLREGLALAVCLLLGGEATPVRADDETDAANNGPQAVTSGDLGVMSYHESAGRISSLEMLANIRSVWSDDTRFDLNLAFDTLSGGSPNGALPSRTVQTFATPSGRTLQRTTVTTPVTAPTVQTCTTASGQVYNCGTGGGGSTSDPNKSIYDVAAGDLPLDRSFTDRRQAISGTYGARLNDHLQGTLNAGYSRETDFQSMTAGVGLSREFLQKNTVLSLGLNTEHDSINPVGGMPVPLSDYTLFLRQNNASKVVNGYQLGLTQVLSRRWLTLLTASADSAHGYQNDPYKIVSGLDSSGAVVGYIFENRPTERTRRSLYWENRFALNRDTITLSARVMRDDWGIRSHTVELRYRYELADNHFIEPQFRWYSQTAADFYRLYVVQGDPYLQNVSADPRLGQFTARTLGVKYGYRFDRDSVLSLRAQRYTQQGTIKQAILPQLQGLDLYPGLTATVFAADLQFRF